MADHIQWDETLVAFRLRMKLLPEVVDWVHDIRLEDDLGVNCCSYIGTRKDGDACCSLVPARNLGKQTNCAALVMVSTSGSHYSSTAHHPSAVAHPGYYSPASLELQL
jgi:hypothetical protein